MPFGQAGLVAKGPLYDTNHEVLIQELTGKQSKEVVEVEGSWFPSA